MFNSKRVRHLEKVVEDLRKRVNTLETETALYEDEASPWAAYFIVPATKTPVNKWIRRILDFLKSEGYTYETFEAGGKWIKEED